MDFRAEQARAARQSRWLRVGLLAGAALTALLLMAACAALVVWQGQISLQQAIPALLLCGAIPIALMLLGSWLRTQEIAKAGGMAVATRLGAVPVSQFKDRTRAQRLQNVVEEMAIAAGIPCPQIAVMPRQMGINAFAAGLGVPDAVVAVTEGCLQSLSRDELQAVIGHEMSHVLHGDMRVNLQSLGTLHGLFMLAQTGRWITEIGRGGGKRGVAPVVALGFVAQALGALGQWWGTWLVAALSRQREWYADASAVQFTHNPIALSNALKKAGALPSGAMVDHPAAPGMAHMWFAGLSAEHRTHPPLTERIAKLDPSFTPAQMQALQAQWAEHPPTVRWDDDAPHAIAGLTNAPPDTGLRLAEPIAKDLRGASDIRNSLPDALVSLCREPQSAVVVLLALGLDHQQPPLDLPARWTAALPSIGLAVAGLTPAQGLPLASLALPSVHALPAAELAALRAVLARSAQSQPSLLRFAMGYLLTQQTQLVAPKQPALRLAHAAPAVACLLSAAAWAGQSERGKAAGAYGAAIAMMGWQQPQLSAVAPAYPALQQALDQLQALDKPSRALLVEALARCVSFDHRLTTEEDAWLRLLCLSLDCPLPLLALAA